MATKKADTGSAAASKGDMGLLEEAYGDALKKRLEVFFDACIDNHQEAEDRFRAGLKLLRDARKRAENLLAD
jgi:hypothetical protein